MAFCPICNRDFLYSGLGRPRKYCSEDCTYIAMNNRRSRLTEKLTRQCEECGKSFQTWYRTQQRFCGFRCRRRVWSRHRKHKDRALTYRSNGAELFSALEIFKRDNFRCQECGRRTLKKFRHKIHDRAPVLDHIMPLSKGGLHIRANVQCLCRRCNTSKGAKIRGQLRLF